MRRTVELGGALLLAVSLAGSASMTQAHRLVATNYETDTTMDPNDDFVEAHGEIGIAGPESNYFVADAQVDSATGRLQISAAGSRAGGDTFPNATSSDAQLWQELAVTDPGGNGSIRATLILEASGSVSAVAPGPDAEIEAQLHLGEFCSATLRRRFDFDGADPPTPGLDCDEIHGTASVEDSTLTVEVHNLPGDIEVRVFLLGDLFITPLFSGEFAADALLQVEALGGASFDPESDTFLSVPEPGATSLAAVAIGALAIARRKRS
jgi:hypothetical protein